jgi:hypothetical protein
MSPPGADLVSRGYGEVGIDFLTDYRPRTTVVFNTPYKDNERFIAHAAVLGQRIDLAQQHRIAGQAADSVAQHQRRPRPASCQGAG